MMGACVFLLRAWTVALRLVYGARRRGPRRKRGGIHYVNMIPGVNRPAVGNMGRESGAKKQDATMAPEAPTDGDLDDAAPRRTPCVVVRFVGL